MKANFAHEFRTPFAAINVSLSSLKKVFPLLFEGYIKACDAGLMDNKYTSDYLYMIENSVKNSLNEIKFCDHYLNRLLLLLKDNSLGSGPCERISVIDLLDHIFSSTQSKGKYNYSFSSGDNFEIEFNKEELESCLQVLLEEILGCKNEQQSEFVIVDIDKSKRELSFEIIKSKSNSYISDCINQFMDGNFQQRHGIGFYLFNQLVSTKHGKINLIEDAISIKFLIKFEGA